MERLDKVLEKAREEGLSGLILSTPENIYYTTDFSPHQLTVSRQIGFAFAAFNVANGDGMLTTMDYEAPYAEIAAQGVRVIPYDTWVGTKTKEEWLSGQTQPKKGPRMSSQDVLFNWIREQKLDRERLGIELAVLPHPFYEKLTEVFPAAEFVDITPLLLDARKIKTEAEIAEFRRLTAACDQALSVVREAIRPGVNELELIKIYREQCFVRDVTPSSWTMLGAGPNASFLTRPRDRVIKDGDVMRFDGGCEADYKGYKTDFSRSYIVGTVDPKLLELKKTLFAAQRDMIAHAKPGMSFHQLYHLAYDQVQEKLPIYTRGHQGHSISLGPQTADPPYISDGNHDLLEPGMILCFEVPFYMPHYQGFNIEDMVLVTEDGVECLTYRTPHWLDSEL